MTRRTILAALVVALAAGGCGAGTETRTFIRWVPFVHVHGHQYIAVPSLDVPTPESELGRVVAAVRHTLEGNVHDPHYRARNGDASFLPVGTRLRSVHGFGSWFRVASVVHHQVTVYQLDRRTGQGGHAFDLRPNRIVALQIRSGVDGSVRNRVVDPELTKDLVSFLRSAQISPRRGNNDTLTCFVDFAYAASPPISFGYDPKAGFLSPGFRVPPPLRDRLGPLGCG